MQLEDNVHAIGAYPPCYYELHLLRFLFLIIKKNIYIDDDDDFRTHVRRRIISIISITTVHENPLTFQKVTN